MSVGLALDGSGELQTLEEGSVRLTARGLMAAGPISSMARSMPPTFAPPSLRTSRRMA
jgi:hypothetical protein